MQKSIKVKLQNKKKVYAEEHKDHIAEQSKVYEEKHKEKRAEINKKYYDEKKINLSEQIKRFKKECQGPIFTCCCCMRDLFKRSVEEFKGPLAKILTEKKVLGYLKFHPSLKLKDEFESNSETKKLSEGFSLCKTCISYLKKSKMPPMCQKKLT